MGTKTGILIGVGIGYVLGARAGRERYEQIRAGASKIRRFPVVARPLDAAGQKVSDFVRAGGEQVAIGKEAYVSLCRRHWEEEMGRVAAEDLVGFARG